MGANEVTSAFTLKLLFPIAKVALGMLAVLPLKVMVALPPLIGFGTFVTLAPKFDTVAVPVMLGGVCGGPERAMRTLTLASPVGGDAAIAGSNSCNGASDVAASMAILIDSRPLKGTILPDPFALMVCTTRSMSESSIPSLGAPCGRNVPLKFALAGTPAFFTSCA